MNKQLLRDKRQDDSGPEYFTTHGKGISSDETTTTSSAAQLSNTNSSCFDSDAPQNIVRPDQAYDAQGEERQSHPKSQEGIMIDQLLSLSPAKNLAKDTVRAGTREYRSIAWQSIGWSTSLLTSRSLLR